MRRVVALAVLFAALVAVAPPWAGAAVAPKAKAARKHHHRHHHSRRDVDGDGIPNRLDRDVDGDGIPNGRDRNVDGDRLRNSRDRNVDGDSRRNTRDRDVDGDGVPNGADQDIDADGVLNAWDPDSDSSGDALVGRARADAKVDPGFFGLVCDDVFWGTDWDPSGERTLPQISSIGVRVLRQQFSWAAIEPKPGVYDFSFHDRYVATLARHGLRVLPILFDPPAFRSSRDRPGSGVYPPRSNDEFAAFAALLVRRYGPSGSFWREHPDVPYLPIIDWQVWNEPNLRPYWPTGPNPAAYAGMLQAVGGAIHAADPAARVVTAGLSGGEAGIPPTRFLRGMYRAGAKGSFDVLAVHPYAPASDLVVDQVSRLVRVLRTNSDDARILITELGWASGGPRNRNLNVGPAGQEALVRSTLPRLVRLRGRLRLDGVFYFNWRDVSAPGDDHWGYHTGLLTEDSRPKPAYWAFQAATGALTR